MNKCEITCMDVSGLSDPALFDAWLDRMPERRRQKVLSFRFEEGRRLSLGAGLLLYLALEKRGMDPGRALIRENEFGQPYLPGQPDFHFSLSHSGRWALCAVCGRPVGCDVEQEGRGREGIPKRFFHPEERALLAREADAAAWQRSFVRIWTRKESYLKAIGKGLSEPMNSFSALSPAPGVWYGEPEGAPKEGCGFACCVIGGDRPEFEWKWLKDVPEG